MFITMFAETRNLSQSPKPPPLHHPFSLGSNLFLPSHLGPGLPRDVSFGHSHQNLVRLFYFQRIFTQVHNTT